MKKLPLSPKERLLSDAKDEDANAAACEAAAVELDKQAKAQRDQRERHVAAAIRMRTKAEKAE